MPAMEAFYICHLPRSPASSSPSAASVGCISCCASTRAARATTSSAWASPRCAPCPPPSLRAATPLFPVPRPCAKPARPPRRMNRELVCKRRIHRKARRVDGGRRPAHSLPLSPPPPSSSSFPPFLLTLSPCNTRAIGIHRQERGESEEAQKGASFPPRSL